MEDVKKLRYINIARIFVLALIVLFVALGVQSSQAFSFKEMTLKFVQISDVHISSKPDTSYKIISNSKDLFADAIEQVNGIKDIDFVMFTGDMVNDPTVENYKDFFTLLSELKYPSLYVLGNHDFAPKGTQGLSKEEVLAIFRQCNPNYVFPASYYAITPKKGFRIIGLDLTIEDKQTSNGFLNDEQKEFLENELKNNQDKIIVIFQHFPVIQPFTADHHKILNDDEYLAIVKQYKNPIIVLTGHYHITKIIQDKNFIQVVTPSLVTYPNAFRLVNITNFQDRVVFEFGFLPTKLTELQDKSRALTMMPSSLLGTEKDRVQTITIKKKSNKAKESKKEAESTDPNEVIWETEE